jgi:hypothetical protein
MQTHNRNTFTTIHTEGALLPADLLQRVSENDSSLEGLSPDAYHLAPGERLNETINRSWNRLTGLWEVFKDAREGLPASDTVTTATRERWLLPLMQELGYGRLTPSRAVEIEGKSYAISHRWQNTPLHLIGCGLELDKRTPGAAGAARISPHSLLQEYLNRAEDAQWGIVSNGLQLRVLRDNATLTRQAYIEFDLESMFEGEIYSDFVLLWLVCHQSRFETTEKQAECILEQWSKSAQKRGTRALDDLRRGVEEAIVSLGQGFLQHPQNDELRTQLRVGDLSAQDYYRQLLRLVYRLIFLFTAEDRDLLLLPDAPVEARQRFLNYYSTTRLRTLAEKQRGSRHHDRYEALRLVMTLLGSDKGCPELAIPALGGFLFDTKSTNDLNKAKLDNQALLTAVRSLAFITEGNTRRAVDYRNLGPEELGSVYEALLELHPLLNTDAGTFELTSAAGNERKTTGSYYTPSSLIKVLLDSALDPVIEDRVGANGNSPSEQEKALLNLKVCDPACGSGHFLIAAAHRIAGKLAEVRSGGDEPPPNETRRALRDVIRHCIYGVDINPMAVELCKVNLWLESIEPGKPLSFLDAHIKCGNSLVGVGLKMNLDDLEVPDEAFNPVTGDHKATAALLKKRNKQEREGQESLFIKVIDTKEDLNKWLAERTRIIETMPEENATDVQAKADAYQKVNESIEYRKQRQVADLWTASFFWKVDELASNILEIVAPTHGQLRRLRKGHQVQPGLLEQVEKLSRSEAFFHWPLEFAEISTKGGFNCVLGNPPWERIKLQEEEFFASRDPRIANAPNKSARGILIRQLNETNNALALAFRDAKHGAECSGKFVRFSNRFPFSAVGDVNTYALFTEHSRDLINKKGFAGIIVPTGIATDDTTKDIFGDLVKRNSISSLYDFENREGIFPNVHRSYKFCLLTLTGITVTNSEFVFFAGRVSHIYENIRHFGLEPSEIALFNPNTLTMPVFRTSTDVELTKGIYRRFPIMVNESTDKNPWGIYYMRFVDLGDHSALLKFLWEEHDDDWNIPLYEAKLLWQYDHRYSTFEDVEKEKVIKGLAREVSIVEKNNPRFSVIPRYYLPNQFIDELFSKYPNYQKPWLLVYRGIARSTDERTSIASIIPRVAASRGCPALGFKSENSILLISNINSFIFDYCSRQKVANISFGFFIMKQMPIIPPDFYSIENISFIYPRALELIFTSYDVKPFADDIWNESSTEQKEKLLTQWEYSSDLQNNESDHNQVSASKLGLNHFPYPPFRWDEDRRALLRAELDAYYANLYGLTRDELRYILDPQDVYGPDFPGETFRVLKEKEIKLYGEYRTRRLVLEAWDRLEASGELPQGVQAESVIEVPTRVKALTPEHSVKPMPQPDKSPVKHEPKPSQIDDAQPALGDMVLYKCAVCGKMVMGFDRGNHERENHGGQSVEWKRME